MGADLAPNQPCCSETGMLASLLQVLQLSQLKDLSLVECGYSADSVRQLSRLASSLTRLELLAEPVPATLDCSYVVQDLEAALPHLAQLTYLVSCRWCAWLLAADGRFMCHLAIGTVALTQLVLPCPTVARCPTVAPP